MPSLFHSFRREFTPNWVSMLVGWQILDYVQRPPSAQEVPGVSFVERDELQEFCLAAMNDSQDNYDAVMALYLMLDDPSVTRQEVRTCLLDIVKPTREMCLVEFRKWRVVAFSSLLENLPVDPLNAHLALDEFMMLYNIECKQINESAQRYDDEKTVQQIKKRCAQWCQDELVELHRGEI